jgi:hypothetical protein
MLNYHIITFTIAVIRLLSHCHVLLSRNHVLTFHYHGYGGIRRIDITLTTQYRLVRAIMYHIQLS